MSLSPSFYFAFHRCSTLVKLSDARLTRRLCAMAERTDPQELTVVKAQEAYNSAAAAIDDILDDFPNPSWDSIRMDTWLIDAVTHWSTCEENWSQAGIVSKEWYKLEYRLIARVPDLPMDKVTFARTEFNELVDRAVRGLLLLFSPCFLTDSFQLDYNLDVVPLPVPRAPAKRSKATVSPSHQRQDTAVPSSRTATPMPLPPHSQTQVTEPASSKRAPIDPAPSSSNPSAPNKSNSPLQATPKPQASNTVTAKANTPLPAASSNSGWGSPAWTPYSLLDIFPPSPTGFDVSFPPDPTSPLHQKPKPFRFGSPTRASRPEVLAKLSLSQLLTVDGTFFLVLSFLISW